MSLIKERPWVITTTVLFLANEIYCDDNERFAEGQGCIN